MSKQITFEHKGKEYTLEYTRETVRQMEARGFNAEELTTKPMTMLPALFEGAFLAHHRNMKRAVVNEIFDTINNRQDMVGKLAEMYNEPIMAMLDEPAESEGNVSWTANW